MKLLQQKAKQIQDKEDEEDLHIYERKKPYYDYFISAMVDPKNNLKVVPFKLKECPEHPANPNHKDYDPNRIW